MIHDQTIIAKALELSDLLSDLIPDKPKGRMESDQTVRIGDSLIPPVIEFMNYLKDWDQNSFLNSDTIPSYYLDKPKIHELLILKKEVNKRLWTELMKEPIFETLYDLREIISDRIYTSNCGGIKSQVVSEKHRLSPIEESMLDLAMKYTKHDENLLPILELLRERLNRILF